MHTDNNQPSHEDLKRKSSTDVMLSEEKTGKSEGGGGRGGQGKVKGILRSLKGSSDRQKGSSLLDMEQGKEKEVRLCVPPTLTYGEPYHAVCLPLPSLSSTV